MRLNRASGSLIQTPRGTSQGYGTRGHTRLGLFAASGLATSTRGLPGVHGNAINQRHPSVSHGYGLGVGLSSGIRTSHMRHGKHDSHGSRGPWSATQLGHILKLVSIDNHPSLPSKALCLRRNNGGRNRNKTLQAHDPGMPLGIIDSEGNTHSIDTYRDE
ncbi:hypothetical protein LX36DRAFT_411275 [Colletotrichum falcatum]|nr:hypothetical protein LX36DRAFT_411275 [Colletotrichum falcatum]